MPPYRRFDPATVRKYRLIGYENRDVADENFRDDSMDFGEIGFSKDVSALYELRLAADAPSDGALATARLRWLEPSTAEPVEIKESILLSEVTSELANTSPHFRQGAAIAEFAELLGESFWAQCGSFKSVAELLKTTRDDLRDDQEHQRFLDALETARQNVIPHCNR